ncbi:uncharacterized protein [Gossypium hirsutum]|uniref:Uncharacterized protein isoform X2 n=1 Tax=Gossypium hirsutum TaxID=3635 RepID=A0ABM3BBI7_GOSHI|nr:uncharacterized protein LOC107945665 isoform X2 [Gossypium hirsutum]
MSQLLVKLDGTHIRASVSLSIQGRFRSHKGGTTQNVLAAITFDLKFSYVLAGWEGSVHGSRILSDALSHPGGLRIPEGLYEEPESDLVIPTLTEREEREEARECPAKRDEIAQTMWTDYMARNIRIGKGNKDGTSKQFRWTKSMEHVFLEILAEEAQKGNKPSNTFRAVFINRVVEAISERFQVQCDAKYVENHLRTVKNQWQIICKIRGESGFGWDDNIKMITCDRATYDATVMIWQQGVLPEHLLT